MNETMTNNARTALVVLAAVGALLAALTLGMASAKPAAAEVVASKTITVPESSRLVDTGIVVQPNDEVVIDAHGSIWAGVWFTGGNGPAGWNYNDCGQQFPLKCSRPFGLIGLLNGRYFYVGDHKEFRHQNSASRLYLRTNDDTPGNGSGAFYADIVVYRGGKCFHVSPDQVHCPI